MDVNKIIQGDCLEVLKTFGDNCIDSIVTDPPYGLSFMGKHWDYDVPKVEVWRECLRVLKPGGHLLSFSGTRTYHRMAVNIEDAGFEIRDMIAWIYGSGFPKSLNIGKAVDKIRGNKREVIGTDHQGKKSNGTMAGHHGWAEGDVDITRGTSEWEGWGTALKPALEPICVSRKPLIGTVAANVLQYGTGGINVDGCRVGYVSDCDEKHQADIARGQVNAINGKFFGGGGKSIASTNMPTGRFPANLIHDGSEEVLRGFPETATWSGVRTKPANGNVFNGHGDKQIGHIGQHADSGSAARFFYCAKASKEDRDGGCEGMDVSIKNIYSEGIISSDHPGTANGGGGRKARNYHPTVKPTDLMRYLCRLVTPPNGLILDPFFGSGSTGKAAKLEHFNYIGIEREPEYCEIAQKRIDNTHVNKRLEFK